MDIFRGPFVILLLALTTTSPFAATENNFFDEGVGHFKRQDYNKAITAFTAAYKKGLKTPALFHNLGVSYYRLGDYPQARHFFELARQYPEQRMLAEYNLGLIAKKQGQTDQATKHFTLVRDSAKEQKLVTLAKIQLGEVRLRKPDPIWSLYAQAGYGRDSNITTLPDSNPTRISGAYTYYDISPELRLVGDADAKISLKASILNYDYVDYDRYDYDKLALGINGQLSIGAWRYTLALENQTSSYGHQDYQDINRLEAGIKFHATADESLQLRYQQDEISSQNPIYYYLEGTRQRLRATLRSYGARYYAKLYYEYEQNDRRDTATSSFSPERHTSHAYLEYSLSDAWTLGAGINYRVSLYPAVATTPEREDTRWRTTLRLSYKVTDNWTVRADREQTDNESNIAADRYQRDISMISLSAIY